ncbi:MAG: hypothetical protein LQ347_001754 [Umbilicaria vellea]|nr:MAG: hypothetical protein LQ347_001754 [Umbilicaria vellea]
MGIDQEWRGFKFFQFQTTKELVTPLRLSSLNQLMLQTSHANPAVLQATIALGSLGDRFQINSVLTTEDSQANNRRDFACRQYNKAVTQLREQLCNIKEPSVDFGNDAGALMHLRSELEILRRE